MKIALIAPIDETIPPPKYGGIEWIVYHLAHNMGLRGHQVDLFTAGNSKPHTEYRIVPIALENLRANPSYRDNMKLAESQRMISIAKTYELLKKENYDIIHNHFSWKFLLFSDLLTQKVLTTHHGPLTIPYQRLVFRRFKDSPYISISNNQRKDLPELNFVKTIYNGIDTQDFPLETNPKEQYLCFLARLSPEKGAIQAAQVAALVKKQILFASKVDIVDKEYFARFEQSIDHQYVNFIGEIGGQEKTAFLQNARCLLTPIQWEEPFGLMFTEAMSCGTPVITFARGSAPEVIEDGVTGFLVNQSEEYIRGDWVIKKTGIQGLCEAVDRMYSMPDDEYKQMRKNAGQHVEKHFSVKRMVDEYEKVYEQLVADQHT